MYLIAMLALALNAGPAWAGKVTMFTDDTHTTKIKREKLDCKVHDTKKSSLSLGFKMSVAFAAKVGPEVTWSKQTGIQWNGMSQDIILKYKVLCDMHNKGHLTVAQFDQRYEKLEGLFDKAVELKAAIEEDVYKRSEKAFDDLEREEARMRGEGGDLKSEIKDKIKKYSGDIAALADEVKAEDAEEQPAESKKGKQARDE